MNKEDKKLQKHLVDEMMKVSKTNPDVMFYMEALMKYCIEREQEIDRLNNIINELEKWLLSEQERYRDYLSTRPTNDSEYNSKYATQCALVQLDEVLDKLKELKESKAIEK